MCLLAAINSRYCSQDYIAANVVNCPHLCSKTGCQHITRPYVQRLLQYSCYGT